jgi:beta-lactamase regulating signal transducer with metallopeptidase domain
VALRALRAGARRLDGVTGPVPAFAVRAPAIVFLAGVFRPKLYVSESILEVLTGEELEAVVAHELAHHHAHDNAKRRVLAFVPDLFARTTLARGLEERWRLAAELSADAAASGCSRRAALALASALVKVARLKAGLMPSECDCAALDSGRAIADRVHRLVSPPRTLEPAANGFLRAAPVGVVLLLLAGVPWLSDLLVLAHEISELVVHLP